MLDAAGVDLPTIQAILRHAWATTTDRNLRDLVGVNTDIDHAFAAHPAGKVLEMKRASGAANSEGSF